MTNSPQNRVGHICLIGAGPGDPGLITVKGLARLREADVVVFDALANPSLLNQARPDAEKIDVGKRAKAHKLTQDQTNQLLVDLAKQGKFVVRLKGGDPYLFGRGAEEAAYVAARGVTCEIVPGITSGIAAPAMAGIPVTHRSIASTVTLITGHEEPGKAQSAIDYASLAGLIRSGGTACFYMSVGRLDAITDSLRNLGLPDETPVAIVQWGTLPRQKSLRSNLLNAHADLAKANMGPPSIVVIGQVAAIDEPGLNYFTNRPLFGKSILVTRTRQQASDLREQLESHGAQVLEAPTIELVEPSAEQWAAVDDAIKNITQYHWLVLTSVNGIRALTDRMKVLGLDARHLARSGDLRIATIGQATDEALWDELRIRADLVPTRYVAESLAGELIAKHGVKNQKVLMLQADIARPALPKLLREAGATVTELVAYKTRKPDALPEDVVEALKQGSVEWITFTSSSTASNLIELLGPDAAKLLAKVKTASIGPITTETLKKLGITPTVEATVSTIPGLVDAILKAENSK